MEQQKKNLEKEEQERNMRNNKKIRRDIQKKRKKKKEKMKKQVKRKTMKKRRLTRYFNVMLIPFIISIHIFLYFLRFIYVQKHTTSNNTHTFTFCILRVKILFYISFHSFFFLKQNQLSILHFTATCFCYFSTLCD